MVRSVCLGVMCLAVAACAPPGVGKAPKFASLGRPLSDDYVQLATFESRLVEINASGRVVRAPAPAGYCFAKDGVMTSDASAFLLLQPCVTDPKAGVVSISVAKHGLFGDDGPTEANFQDFQAFLETREGASHLGLDAGSGAIFLIDTEYRNGALYAVARDASAVEYGFSGDFICRAFTEVNGRMAVVSLISAKADARKAEELMEDLKSVVNQLQKANARAGA